MQGGSAIEQLFGREREVGRLSRLLDEALVGPAAILVAGEAGIGKTALLRRACADAEARGFHVLRAQPAEGETAFAFAGLGDLFAAMPRAIEAALPEPQRRSLDVALLRASPERADIDRGAVAQAVLTCMRALARQCPVLIAIDDVQWLDRSSTDSLAFAFRRLGDLPVAIVLTTRSNGAGASLGLDRLPPPGRFSQVRPGPLSLAGLQRTIRDRLGQTFARPILTRIERDSGGNPFYALQIAEALAASGRTPRAGEALPVPDSLERLVRSRIERAPARVRPVAEVIAIVGAAPPEDIAALVGGADPTRAIEAGVREGLLEATDRGVALVHPLIAAAVYSSMAPERRRVLHRRAAELATDPEIRAGHLASGSEGPDEEVATALDLAADRAAQRGAPDGAAGYAALACRMTDPSNGPVLAVRRTRLGSWQFAAGDPVAAERTLRLVIGDAPSGRARALALMELCWVAQETAGYGQATRLGESALRHVPDDIALRARIHADVSRLCDHDAVRKLAHAQAAMALTARLTEPGPELVTRACLALAEARFFLGQGLSMGLVDEARKAEPPAPAGRLMPGLTDRFLAWIQSPAGDAEAGHERRVQFLHAAVVESPSSLPRALGWITRSEINRGDWAAAERHAREHLDVADWGGGGVARAWPLSALATVHALTGRIAEARAEALEAKDLGAASTDVYLTIEALMAQAVIAGAVGDAGSAVAHLGAVDAHYTAIGLREPAFTMHLPNLAEALLTTGDLAAAGAVLARLQSQAAGAAIPWAVASAARVRGLLAAATGDLNGAHDALDEAVVAFRTRVGMPFELGRALLARGIVHRRADRRRLAADSIGEAISIFEDLGATPWLARAREEVARVPLRRAIGPGLTPTEAQVAGLAATGASNREIAATMFIGVKTVEANLTRIYAKLDVRSRAGLAAAMAGASRRDRADR